MLEVPIASCDAGSTINLGLDCHQPADGKASRVFFVRLKVCRIRIRMTVRDPYTALGGNPRRNITFVDPDHIVGETFGRLHKDLFVD